MALYAAEITTRDICDHVKNLYDVGISSQMVSNITNKITPLVIEWQKRPLEKTYSFVFMDILHYKVRDEKQIIIKAAYGGLGVNMDCKKSIRYMGSSK